jgi:hypothetical protein
MISALQATYAGTSDGLAGYLEPYVDAGVEHVVLRVADEPERGLHAAAGAVETLARCWGRPGSRLEQSGLPIRA